MAVRIPLPKKADDQASAVPRRYRAPGFADTFVLPDRQFPKPGVESPPELIPAEASRAAEVVGFGALPVRATLGVACFTVNVKGHPMLHSSRGITSYFSAILAILSGPLAASVSAADSPTAAVRQTGCNCGSGGGVVAAAPAPYLAEDFGPVPDGGIEGHAPFGPPPAPWDPAPGPIPQGPHPVGPPPAGLNPNADGPPPGTVGQTYRRPSRLIPSDKHPRTAMIDVSVEDAYDVSVDGMKAYRAKDGIWRLETKEPLIPGLPHIYHVRAVLGEGDDAPVEYRTVRLIPGRILDLQW